MSNKVFKRVLVSTFGRNPAQRDHRAETAVSLFVQVSDDHFTAVTAVLSDPGVDGEGGLRRCFKTITSLALTTPIRLSCAPQQSLPKFQGFPYLCLFL